MFDWHAGIQVLEAIGGKNNWTTQKALDVLTCYELQRPVLSSGVSIDDLVDSVGCQVKQIQVVFHGKTFLEAVFETDVAWTKIVILSLYTSFRH